nr:DNA polymerase Y family protein [Actibacterium sp. 188UL27-1]
MERSGNPAPDDVAAVLATDGPHGPVIHATNRAARLAGVTEGARVVDVKPLCPDLRVEYADIAGDRAALDQLVLWMRRWCPWTVADGANGVILDVTGAAHLFGGEAALVVDIEAQLSLLGLTAQLAIAPTWGAAWGLARFGSVRAICGKGEVAQAMAPLPVSALRLDDDTLLLLRRLGLKTIGSLAKIPRLSLTRRFSRVALPSNPLMRLDQAMGKLAEPVSSVAALPPFRAIARLAEPIQDPTPYLPGLCEDLCEQLSAKGMGCRRLGLTVYRSDGEVSVVEVATSSPSRDAGHLHRLFDDKLEQINPGFGFDLITLQAGGVEPVAELQAGLEGDANEDLHLSQLVDRLTARFGARSVTQPVLRDSHMPERAEDWAQALHRNRDMQQVTMRKQAKPLAKIASVGAQNEQAAVLHFPQAQDGSPPQVSGLTTASMPPARADVSTVPPGSAVPVKERPIRLLDRPEEIRVLYAVPEGPPVQFTWRRQTHKMTRYQGPERIAPEWWQDAPGTRLRDYYKIEDQAGRRLWLYREGLHEDGRGGDPRWFVHGMFA